MLVTLDWVLHGWCVVTISCALESHLLSHMRKHSSLAQWYCISLMFGDHFSFTGFHHNDTSIVRIAHVPFRHLCSWLNRWPWWSLWICIEPIGLEWLKQGLLMVKASQLRSSGEGSFSRMNPDWTHSTMLGFTERCNHTVNLEVLFSDSPLQELKTLSPSVRWKGVQMWTRNTSCARWQL